MAIVLRKASMAVVLCLGAAAVPARLMAADGRPVPENEMGRPRAASRDNSRDAVYGRAVVFRAGEMPRVRSAESDADKTRTATPTRPTHYLDTTLPVIIQGAPHRVALRRHVATG